ncbi:alpha/beta-hydrolase [Acephala macrosclerotiorum]|nr:alpha/beta-hydrolase [Acephala macrosclerotiorum]
MTSGYSDLRFHPTNVGFYIYIPSVTPNLAVIVAMYYCTGTAQAYYSGTQYATLADQHGFIVIYPNAPTSGGCWDAASTATLTHNAGGDSLGIASIVRYTISTYGADTSRVFMTGTSSGAMMTNVLAGAYPDFSAWNSRCATGELIKTAQAWGDGVRAGYLGYTGTRPRLQMWHGTVDTTPYYQNFIEENKECVGHTVPIHKSAVLDWFGITGSLFPSSGTSTTSTTPTLTTATTAITGQCGGISWTGSPCTYSNAYYSQCL